MYATGRGGLPLDLPKAAQWMQKAANQGHAGAQFRECPAYTLLYKFSPKDTGQSKVK